MDLSRVEMETERERVKESSLVHWACNFPVGGPAMAADKLLTTSHSVSCTAPHLSAKSSGVTCTVITSSGRLCKWGFSLKEIE